MATKKDWFLVCWLNVVGPLLLVKPKISQQKMPLDRKLFRWHFFLDFCVKIWLPMWRGWEDISILIMCQRIHLSGDREKHSWVTECGCWWRSGRINGMWDSRKSSERLKNLEEIGRICRYIGRIWVICVWSLDKFLDRKKISIYIGLSEESGCLLKHWQMKWKISNLVWKQAWSERNGLIHSAINIMSSSCLP